MRRASLSDFGHRFGKFVKLEFGCFVGFFWGFILAGRFGPGGGSTFLFEILTWMDYIMGSGTEGRDR